MVMWNAEDLKIWREVKASFDREQHRFREARKDPEKGLYVAAITLNGAAQKLMEADLSLGLKQKRGRGLLADINNY